MKIKAIEVQLKDSVTQKLQRGWTDVIVRKSWETASYRARLSSKINSFLKNNVCHRLYFLKDAKSVVPKSRVNERNYQIMPIQ